MAGAALARALFALLPLPLGFIQHVLFTVNGTFSDSAALGFSVQHDFFPVVRVYITVFQADFERI